MEVTEDFIQSMDSLREPNKDLGLIGACSENVVVFSEYMLGLKPYAWQVYFLNKVQKSMENSIETKEFAGITSRQIGKSTAVAVLGLWSCVFNKYPGTIGNNTIYGITSASDAQAKKLLNEIKKLIRMGDQKMSEYKDDEGNPLFGKTFFSDLLSKVDHNNTTTITFENYDEKVHGPFLLKGSRAGSVIKSYPPTSVVLGETFTVVVIDEAGKTDRITDEFFFEYIYPTGNSTNAVRIYISTPWTSSGFFYRLIDPDNLYGNYDVFKVIFDVGAIQIEKPEYYARLLNIVKQLNSDGKNDEAQRAYYCRFVKGEKSYFDPNNVMEVFDKDLEMCSHYVGECDMGIDFGGQTTSRTVITISALGDDGKTINRLYHKYYGVGEDNSLIDDVKGLLKYFNVQRIIPDDCLVSGTEVLMKDYSIKEIQDINVGDYVVSYDFKDNTYKNKKVIRTIETEEKDVYTVSFRNGTQVTTSGNHKWFAKRRSDDKVVVVTTKNLDPKKYYIPAATELPELGEEPVSEAEAYILGMYIAEGHKRPTKKAFFVSQLKEDTRNKIKENLCKTNFIWQENKKGFYLSDVGELHKLFCDVGTGSNNKTIPVECFRWDTNLLQSLYEGLMDGDGCVQPEHKDKRGYNVSETESYYTISEKLCDDFRLLSLLLGKPTHYRLRAKSGFNKFPNICYEPIYCENSPKNEGKMFISSIEKNYIKEKTYDIEVEDTHSFVLPHSQVITHNCPQGDYLIRQMKDKGWNVHPMNFKAEKVKKFGAFRSALNKGRIHSYDDDLLKTEMLALEVTEGERSSKIKHAPGYSDDFIDSFLLSCYFFVQEENEVKFFDFYEDDLQ